jgi:hypothetical protein
MQIQLQFVAAQRIDALGLVRDIIELAEVSWTSRMIEYEFAIQFAKLIAAMDVHGVHAKILLALVMAETS